MQKRKIDLVSLNHWLLAILFLAQPFIVMFQSNIMRDIQLFGFSVFEFFNIILVLISLGLCIYTYPDKRKFIKFIPYVVLLGVYTLLHGWNIYQFNQDIYSLQTPNFLVESYYIFRTFVVPLLLLFDLYYARMPKEKIVKLFEIFIFILSFVMVVTNVCGIALRNYAEDYVYNELRIFDWFTFANTSKYSYYLLTTMGWFLSGNQMSAILFMSYPLTLWLSYRQPKWYRYVLVILQTLSMFMLGTRTANMGSILILVMFIILWIFFTLLKQPRQNILFICLVTVVFAGLFPYSPLGYKMKYEKGNPSKGNGGTLLDSAVNVEIKEGETSVIDFEKLARESLILKNLDVATMGEEEKEFVRSYMAEFCGYFGISPYILEHYNDLDHSVFWANYMQKTPNNDYRVLKTMILKNIQENNQNPLDKYLGIGYTLNYIYTEADYSYQYYTYGLMGFLVLIGPYFVLLLYVLIQGLKHFKAMFTMESAIYFICPMLGLVAAKFSGHVLERVFPLIVLALLMSILLVHTRDICIESKSELL